MKEILSSVSQKGQVTIPAEIRQLLGVKPKDRVAFRVQDGEVKLTPAPSPIDQSFQAVPALKTSRTLAEMAEIAREEHAQEASKESLKTS